MSLHILANTEVSGWMSPNLLQRLNPFYDPYPVNLENLNVQALALYEKGDLEQSQRVFKEVIEVDALNMNALTHLGRIAARQEKLPDACYWLARAAALPEAGATVHYELGCFLELRARSDDELALALQSYSRAVELDINQHAAFFNKANIHKRRGEVELALQSYNAAIYVQTLNPYYFNNRGDLLLQLKSLPFALQDFDRAIELDPSIGYFQDNKGSVLKELRRLDESSVAFKRSLAIDPENALTYNNFGSLFLEQEVWDKALACFEMALRIEPGFYYALYNKGLLYQRFNLLDKALECYQKALLSHPASMDVKWNISIIELTQGDLKKGLIGYEERYRLPENRGFAPKTSKPFLTSLIGDAQCKRILIWNEHGLGNEIFFAGFLRHPWLASKDVIVKFDPRLSSLLSASFKDFTNIRFISSWEEIRADDYDAHAGIASLPFLLGIDIDLAQLYALNAPYLQLEDKVRTHEIRQSFGMGGISNTAEVKENEAMVGKIPKLLVGISWKSVNQKTGSRRSIALEQLMGVLKGLPIQLVNLQYGDVQGDVAKVYETELNETELNETELNETELCKAKDESTVVVEPLSADLPVLQSSGVDNFSNIYALAEVIKACDLVVSIDNSTLHLASALGRPTCALIPFVADWRWFLKREDSPWYKSIKLYRQVKMGQWDDPLMQLRVDLERALAIL